MLHFQFKVFEEMRKEVAFFCLHESSYKNYTIVNMPSLKIKVCIEKLFSLILIQNICCGYSKEPSQ